MTETAPLTGLPAYRARVSATKRAAIIQAATELFGTNGYTGTRMAEVAYKADVSTATIYKHFHFQGCKERLFWTCAKIKEKVSHEEFALFIKAVMFAEISLIHADKEYNSTQESALDIFT
ncbi:MAG: helix-turn-helix transcriptional regulator [Rhodobacteraceae bacterium]|nr:helix-turn-helix transcriptional regulator [Paracoccaceae bacterium]